MADGTSGAPLTPRREYATGSIYQRASDGRWIGTLEAGTTVDGTRRRIHVTGKTESVVKRKLRDKRREIELEGVPATGGRLTVRRWAEGWLENRRTKVRAGPWATDATAVRRWIIPTIGHKRLDALSPADVRAVALAQRNAGRSSSTAHRNHRTLMLLLKDAMLDGHQVPARVLMVEAPALAANDLDAMPADQIEAVMTVALEHLPHWSRWLVQVLYGQRPAEVLGYTWDAIDFERHTMTVEWQLQALPYIDRKHKELGFVIPDGLRVRHLVDSWHLTEPKTKKGQRVVPMLPIVEAALLEWREISPESPHGLVWPTVTGRPANEKDDLAEWYALQEGAGRASPQLRVGHPAGRYWKVYEARHAFATRLLEGGVDERVVNELMGHSTVVSGHGYRHVRQDLALEALTRINQGLAIGPATPPEDAP